MLKEIAWLFIKLGTTAFGGPAAHIAMMEDEIVRKRRWMDRQHFLDLVGATNLIPGPNSTEMAIHCGYHRAGVTGLIVAGTCFILPAILLTSLLAHFYLRYGALPQVAPFLYGIKPAIIVVILNAVFRLGRQAAKGWKLVAIGLAVAVTNFIGGYEIFCILAGGVIGGFAIRLSERLGTFSAFFPISTLSISAFPAILQGMEKADASLLKLFLSFLKIGATLFGSGYVLVAYLDGEFVQGLQWITRQQLLDAIAIGQFTPGPVLSTATFIGYQMTGGQGALLATLGIFLPSFIFVLIINPLFRA